MIKVNDKFPFILPEILSAYFSQNPVNINQNITLIINIEEKLVYLDPEYIYSNEIYSGEV